MESWMISLGIALLGYVAMFVTTKSQTQQNSKDIEKLQNINVSHKKEDDIAHGSIFTKLDIANEVLAEHKVKLGTAPTMEQVRAEFVSKEMFKQMEKHIDEKFDKLENGIDKILNKLEK
jgi:hypothetical protein